MPTKREPAEPLYTRRSLEAALETNIRTMAVIPQDQPQCWFAVVGKAVHEQPAGQHRAARTKDPERHAAMTKERQMRVDAGFANQSAPLQGWHKAPNRLADEVAAITTEHRSGLAAARNDDAIAVDVERPGSLLTVG